MKITFAIFFLLLFHKVNANYTNWGKWTKCDAKCGRGFQQRWRSCSNPMAFAGGRECPAYEPDSESRPCFLKACKGLLAFLIICKIEKLNYADDFLS